MEIKNIYEAVAVISKKIDENKANLIYLDQQNGDGDLGISMCDGFRAVLAYLQDDQEADMGKALNQCGNRFNEAAPSSLGTILSFGIKGMARCLKGKISATTEELAQAMDEGLGSIMSKAGAKSGEKTIVDALFPGVEALKSNAGNVCAYRLAAEAARAGSENTKQMKAVWGRAAYYGEQSIGLLDGGSVVGALIFEAIAEYAETLKQKNLTQKR